jgi:hypothetical protein
VSCSRSASAARAVSNHAPSARNSGAWTSAAAAAASAVCPRNERRETCRAFMEALLAFPGRYLAASPDRAGNHCYWKRRMSLNSLTEPSHDE